MFVHPAPLYTPQSVRCYAKNGITHLLYAQKYGNLNDTYKYVLTYSSKTKRSETKVWFKILLCYSAKKQVRTFFSSQPPMACSGSSGEA